MRVYFADQQSRAKIKKEVVFLRRAQSMFMQRLFSFDGPGFSQQSIPPRMFVSSNQRPAKVSAKSALMFYIKDFVLSYLVDVF